MANKRVFVAFAIEDQTTKILFTGQAKNKNVPYDFVDMSVKEPWDTQWKTNCRTKIKGCDGFITLISKNTKNATGQLWEINCAKEEKIPIFNSTANDPINPWSSSPLYPFCGEMPL